MYEYSIYIYILLIFSHSYSQFIYTRKNVSRFFLHQQYLYLSPSTSKHHLVLSLQYSFPIRLGDDLKKQLPFRLKKCTDGGTWEKNPTKSHLHPRKQTWNLKIPPWKRRNIDPTPPIFWRLPYLFSGMFIASFERVNVQLPAASGTCEPVSPPHLVVASPLIAQQIYSPRPNLQATHMHAIIPTNPNPHSNSQQSITFHYSIFHPHVC